MMNIWQKIEAMGNVKSDALMVIVTMNMLVLGWYCHFKGKPLQSEMVIFALGIVAGKTYHAVKTDGGSNDTTQTISVLTNSTSIVGPRVQASQGSDQSGQIHNTRPNSQEGSNS